jgi:outer membrane lipoprotein SlyB
MSFKQTSRRFTMDNTIKPKSKSNPVFVIAAIAITLFSAIGIGTMTGLIPSSFSNSDAKKAAAVSTDAALKSVAPKAVETPVMAPVDTAKLSAEPKSDAALAKAEDKVLQPEAPAAKPAAAPAHKPAPHKTVVAANTHTAPKPATAPASAPAQVNDTQYIPAPAPVQVAAAPAAVPAAPVAVCNNCGVVEAIRAVEQQGDASGVGAVIGGVAGGVVGHQVGSGRGRDLATVLGAVGGAVAGNQVEKSRKAVSAYDVVVRMDDNSSRTVRTSIKPAAGVGQKVKIVDGQIVGN